MATCVDVAGVPYPKQFGGQAIQALEGVSLQPAFLEQPLQRADALYFEHHLNCAIRDGRWKLVRKGNTGKKTLDDWELYNMETGRTELDNLARQHPQRVKELEAKWEAWTQRARVKPWPWKVDRQTPRPLWTGVSCVS